MSHRNVFHALDKTLQDLRGSSAIMGGTTVVLASDFRQTLLIITRGTPVDQIRQFVNKLLQIGDGIVPEDPSTCFIIMPCGQIVNSLDELLSKKQLPGQEYAYKFIDCILNDDEAVQYPIEFLNSIQTPDLQAHNLILKVGAPIMLIRNIDAPRLCNDTRLIVKKLMQHVIQATVPTGCAKGRGVKLRSRHYGAKMSEENTRNLGKKWFTLENLEFVVDCEEKCDTCYFCSNSGYLIFSEGDGRKRKNAFFLNRACFVE
ncbi:ATP-dependent DNA helicase [Trichonephila inaurata madagascariensis]|uniref:ATP-dependent DNA helicase n=1 Tax=Trichonephila inaurata madagascariensis TaxID=2747483 RepID=A0A8X6MEK2_9ARAC|nr:ATP-dependent DNA helicase [Trichonephila inaurata madagascariensis]